MFNRATNSEIFRYAFGGLGSNLPFYLMMTYLTYFYTDIYGIQSAFVIANIMLVARFFDAISAPLFGIISDRTKTKLGRYRPWIIFGAPVIGFLVMIIFFVPNLNYDGKIVYAYVTYILYSTISDAVNIPFQSLTAVISEDPQQRTLVVTAKQGMAVVAQLLIMVFALPIVELFGGGESGWFRFGIVIGVIVTISFWICSTGVKRTDQILEGDFEKIVPKISLKQQSALIFKNKPLILLLLAFCTSVLSMSITSAINIFYFKYVLQNEKLVPLSAIMVIIGMAAGLLILPILSKNIGKKRTYILFSIIGILPFSLLWMFSEMSITAILFLFALSSFCQGISSNIGWAMVPEIIDYGEWKYGIKGNATITSAVLFVNKLGMAIGGFIASFILGTGGFIANVDQSITVLNLIVFMRFGIPIIAIIIGVLSMSKFDIDEKKVREMRLEIEERKI